MFIEFRAGSAIVTVSINSLLNTWLTNPLPEVPPMRRLILATLIASILAGCGTAPSTGVIAKARAGGATKAVAAAAKPGVRTIPGYKGPQPSVSVTATGSAAEVAASEEAAAAMLEADMSLESIELLIQDGGAYFVQGWFQDLKDWAARTWQRFKLSREVKSALKRKNEKAFELHEGEIDTLRKNRTAPVTKINTLADAKEIVTTWKSTDKGAFDIETRRVVDDEGVTQTLSVSVDGVDKKGQQVAVVRIRTLVGDDGTYKVATKRTVTLKDAREEYQEWIKTVNVDGTESITGYMIHRDGYRTDVTGTRDAKGKVEVEVSKIAPAHAKR